MMPDTRFILFALTGLGNQVLESLAAEGLAPDLVVTRAERGPYPYGPVPYIGDIAEKLQIPWRTEVEGEHDVADRGASLLMVATYHRLIRSAVREACEQAINLHPSLLPRNRGASPIFWSIYNGDDATGITAHRLTDKADAGAICAQRTLQISGDDTQSSLRGKLGDLAAAVAIDVVNGHRGNRLIFREQNAANATAYPRVDDALWQIDLSREADQIRRHINALRDWPLARLGNMKIRRVVTIVPYDRDGPPASPEPNVTQANILQVRAADADMMLELDPPA